MIIICRGHAIYPFCPVSKHLAVWIQRRFFKTFLTIVTALAQIAKASEIRKKSSRTLTSLQIGNGKSEVKNEGLAVTKPN